MNEFNELYRNEAMRGEKIAFIFRWFLVIVLLSLIITMITSGKYVEEGRMAIIIVSILTLYNLILTYFLIIKKENYEWVRYVSATIDITLLTIHIYTYSLNFSQLAVATAATILIYPILILLAALRFDTKLIIYATLYVILCFNLAYFLRYPALDQGLIRQVVSADPMGHFFKSVYFLFFGILLLNLPKTIIRLIDAQSKALVEKKDFEANLALEKQRRELTIRKNNKIDALNKELKAEKEKTDKLLFSILPAKVAQDLKEDGKTKPQKFPHVTVYISDIVGFTEMSTRLKPNFLIDELNDLFTDFDNFMELHHCERIKTVGDAYIAVCGMPEPNQNHAHHIVRAAIDIMRYLKKRNQINKIQWKIRVGIHTGKVVGGVVGVKKYVYDVFGDTINTTSRMESNSESMKINVSETTYQLLKQDFKFIKRVPLEVKGKGAMKMYFVDWENDT